MPAELNGNHSTITYNPLAARSLMQSKSITYGRPKNHLWRMTLSLKQLHHLLELYGNLSLKE